MSQHTFHNFNWAIGPSDASILLEPDLTEILCCKKEDIQYCIWALIHQNWNWYEDMDYKK